MVLLSRFLLKAADLAPTYPSRQWANWKSD